MNKIIKTEFIKIKRYSVIKAGFLMMSLSVLLTWFFTTASAGPDWSFQLLVQEVIRSNATLFFPIVVTLVAGYIITREKTDDTLKNILTIPITFTKLLIGKLIVMLLLTILFSLFNGILTVLLNVLIKFPGMTVSAIILAFMQIICSNIFIYISMLPIIIVVSRMSGNFIVGVAIAFIYGYFGTFEGKIMNWVPVKASMIAVNSNFGAEYGFVYNRLIALLSLLIIFLISILLLKVMGEVSEIKTHTKNKKKAPLRKKGW